MAIADVETMEAGDAMNVAIAKVVGLSFPSRPMPENWRPRTFRPSTDWNDAMYAAEKFGLLDTSGSRRQLFRASRDGEPTTWYVIPYEDDDECSTWSASAPTGPLAICRAILKLHVESDT